MKITAISRKAYAKFVDRINAVFSDHQKRESMLEALDCYLADSENFCAEDILTPDCALVFAMMKFEIDSAMARSARARLRARERKQGNEGNAGLEAAIAQIMQMIEAEKEADTQSKTEFIPPKTRRERRAEERKSRPKMKVRKLWQPESATSKVRAKRVLKFRAESQEPRGCGFDR